jgi:hypothetical protein
MYATPSLFVADLNESELQVGSSVLAAQVSVVPSFGSFPFSSFNLSESAVDLFQGPTSARSPRLLVVVPLSDLSTL